MKNLLIEISQKATKYEDFNFTPEQIEKGWLGNSPAIEDEISKTENRLGVKFPEDYKEFLKGTNGFSAPNSIEPSFARLEEVDYFKIVNEFVLEAYDYMPELETAIIIGGIHEDQQFLLLPPNSNREKWRYWKFANWHPGEKQYKDLKTYFENVLELIVKEHET